jgi:lipopolysaccharide biosynthesis glycosyltransferase
MQYLYTLTSSPDDIYYEQFLLSAASLKLVTPDASVILLCDSKTKETLTGNRREYEKFVSQTITADAPGDMNQIEVSRWVRTSMRRLVSGDFLFLDGDTIVTDDLSPIAAMDIKFGSCLDKHLLIDNHPKKKNIIGMDNKLGFNSHVSNRHYNGGVLFCADTPEVRKLFDRWHELWYFSRSKKIQRDQPALNMAIHENQSLFTELDGTWNCQISHNGLRYLSNSKIIHYFATDLIFNTSPFLLASDKIFKQIKQTGVIPDETQELLKNPRVAFESEARIIAGDDILSVINSNFFQFVFLMKIKIPFLFNFFDRLCSAGKKITKSVIVKTSRKKDSGIKFYN